MKYVGFLFSENHVKLEMNPLPPGTIHVSMDVTYLYMKLICNYMSNIEKHILTLPSINQCILLVFTEDAYMKRDQSELGWTSTCPSYNFWIQNNISVHHYFIFRWNHVNIYILQAHWQISSSFPHMVMSSYIDSVAKYIPNSTSG